MKKWHGRDLTKFSEEECQALPLGRNNGMDHTGEQPAGRSFAEKDLRVLGTPS